MQISGTEDFRTIQWILPVSYFPLEQFENIVIIHFQITVPDQYRCGLGKYNKWSWADHNE